MTAQERLQFCRICTNQKFDPKRGIVCGLTMEKPTFEATCESFNEDPVAARKELERQQERAEADYESGSFRLEKKGMKAGVLGGIGLIVLAAVWFFVGLEAGRIFFYPPILAVIGLVAIIKGAAEGNIAGEKHRRKDI